MFEKEQVSFGNDSIELSIAGDYLLTIFAGTSELFRCSFDVVPGKVSEEFTEVINTHMFFRGWEINTTKMFQVQLRDVFGNLISSDEALVEVFLTKIQGNVILKQFGIEYAHTGIYECLAFLDVDVSPNSDYTLQIKVNGLNIMYSPFSIEFGSETTSKDLVGADSNTLGIDSSPRTLQTMEYFNQKAGATRRRALKALSKERSKLACERGEIMKTQSAKRTGGGFLVHFSKEISTDSVK
jgi:hypothetical protein